MAAIRPSKALIGAAGVHFVCGELSRRGFIALPTTRNTRGIDIVAVAPNGETLKLQVKTIWKGRRWPVPPEDKIEASPNHYFVFVNLKGSFTERPEYYMVSSQDLKDYIKKGFEAWLAGRSRSGKPRDPKSRIRNFPYSESYYKEEAFQKLLGKPINLEDYNMDKVLTEKWGG